MSEGEEVKTRLEAELREKIKKMEKEVENATVKAAGKHCCNNAFTSTNTRTQRRFETNTFINACVSPQVGRP